MIKRLINRAPDNKDGGFSLADIDADDSTIEIGNDKDTDGDGDDKDEDEEDNSDKDKDDADADPEDKDKDSDKDDKSDDDKDDDNDDSDDEEEEETSADAESFLAELNELRGDEIEVDYGDVDPLSAAGVVIRERALEEQAVEKFSDYLESNYPKAYMYLLHAQSGKPDDEFFGNSSDLESIPTEEEVQASVDVQKQILLADLLAKGNSEKNALIIIKNAIEESTLEEDAIEARKNRELAQKSKLDAAKAESDRLAENRQNNIRTMEKFVDDVVSTGQLGSIKIPEKDRLPFAKAFKDSIRLEGDKFVVVTPITKENIDQLFGKEYFSYKKGDLSKLVEAKAKTVSVNRLKTNQGKAEKVIKTKAQTTNVDVPLGDL